MKIKPDKIDFDTIEEEWQSRHFDAAQCAETHKWEFSSLSQQQLVALLK